MVLPLAVGSAIGILNNFGITDKFGDSLALFLVSNRLAQKGVGYPRAELVEKYQAHMSTSQLHISPHPRQKKETMNVKLPTPKKKYCSTSTGLRSRTITSWCSLRPLSTFCSWLSLWPSRFAMGWNCFWDTSLIRDASERYLWRDNGLP